MPVLLYGCETWASTQVDIRRLITFHMRCIRSILGVTRLNKIRNTINLKSAKEEPIERQIQHQRLRWLGHLEQMNVSHLQKLLLRSKLHNMKRPQHGPKNRWIDTIQRDLVSSNTDLSQANDHFLAETSFAMPKPLVGIGGIPGVFAIRRHVFCPLTTKIDTHTQHAKGKACVKKIKKTAQGLS